VKQSGYALQYANKSFHGDREVVLAAVRQQVLHRGQGYGYALAFADKSLKADREFMLAAVKVDGMTALENSDNSLLADREFMLAAVKQDGDALEYASEELQQDEELMKVAGVEYDSEPTEIVVNYDPKQNETDYIVSVLDKIIDGHLDHFKKSNQFKVRPGYSYDKFYLDRVQGSFDQSLNGLIHHIMFQDGIYKELLTDEQYESCKKVVEEEPGSIWGPSNEDDDYDSVQDNLDDIYGTCILHVHERLKEEGFQIDELDDYCEQFS